MGMYFRFYRLPPGQLQRMLDDSEDANACFDYDVKEAIEKALRAHFNTLKTSGRFLDIERAWHSLNFLLTGDASLGETSVPPPLGNVFMGGTSTNWETAYDYYRYLLPHEVKRVSEALGQLSREELRQRYDPDVFDAAKLYPSYAKWNADDIEPLLDILDQVIAFYRVAAESGDTVLMAVE